MWTLPNILTLSRIIVIPGLVGSFFLNQPFGSHLAFILFTVAGITDFFDGYVARKMKSESRIGEFLDPIADKLMVATVIIMVVSAGWVSGLHVIPAVIIMCRELLVSGLREFLAGIRVSVPVTILAKWKTTVQMIALGALCWTKGAPILGLPALEIGLIGLWGAAVLTLYTGYDYLRSSLKHMV